MKKEYILKGLDCANCAAEIERAVSEAEGVASASVNFVKGTLRVKWSDGHKGDLKTVESIVRRIEPDVTVAERSEHGHDDGHDHGSEEAGKFRIARLMVGAAVFVTGLFLEYLFDVHGYIPLSVYTVGFLILGGDVVFKALRNILHGKIFDENLLMSIATIGAFIIGEYAEAVGVMLFYQTGELFQYLAVAKAKRSITRLMDIRPDFANIKKDGELVKVAPDTVQIGDIIVVKPGEKIPLDGIVTEGEAMLDTAALTGESIPRKASAGDTVLSGSVDQNGVLTIRVTQTFGESTVSKIIDLVENATEKKAPTENFITKFAKYYTPIVVGLAVLLAVLPPIFIGISDGSVWTEWIRRGLIFLVISCPCALVISIPLGFFGGIGGAARNGVLIKGGNYLEALNKTETVVFDKTGTLTKGVFKVTEILPSGNFTREQLLGAAAKAEAFSNHPIALSVLKEYGTEIDKSGLKGYTEIAGHGISVNDSDRMILAGNARLMERENIVFEETQSIGTKVYVAINGAFAGCIVISDEIKPDSRGTITALKARGIRTVMLTGDNPGIAKAVADEIGLDEVYGGLLPQQKVEKVEWLNGQKKKGGKLVFMGDGINDAPVLALSDIGISMGGLGSDAAIEAADMVIMTDEPSKLITAMDTARFTRRIVWQNIIFALAVKGVFLMLGAVGAVSMWEAVFADVGVALIAIMNALRVIHRKGKSYEHGILPDRSSSST
ncbi:MAG: cadmium-translocating P-type ATPase [Methanomassiliicoccaceae archaeon]|jgi:Cd2+/Zn2+-exporting ATPase|nr:cadmium-translocating P-type ATPase [Methanomassiliicoccaceae archaeon]